MCHSQARKIVFSCSNNTRFAVVSRYTLYTKEINENTIKALGAYPEYNIKQNRKEGTTKTETAGHERWAQFSSTWFLSGLK